ncbi:MAG: hypothetical protein LCH91_15945 [Bacteroidetes bacterium]|nr:hypothetical protein [Bacteroidota bacterium]
MTQNELNIQAISTKQADFYAYHIFLFGQLTEKREKASHSYFLKSLLASQINDTFCFTNTQADP